MSESAHRPHQQTAQAVDEDALVEHVRASIAQRETATAIDALKRLAGYAAASREALHEAAQAAFVEDAVLDVCETYLKAARWFAESGDAGAARARLEALAAADPKNIDARFELGLVELKEGRSKEALELFLEVLRLSNLKHLPALFEAGCLYQASNEYDSAVLAFKRLLDREKTHVGAMERLGQIHRSRHMMPEAIDYYRRAAECAQSTGDEATAARLLKTIIAIDGSNLKARQQLEKLEKAVAARAQSRTAAAPPSTPAPAPPPTRARATPEVAAPATPAAPAVGATTSPKTTTTGAAGMEQKPSVTADLARVTAAVADAYKKRLAVEEELKSAQAVLTSLHAQGVGLEESLTELRQQFETTLAAKAAEDSMLAELAEAKKKALAELSAMASLTEAMHDAEQKASGLSAFIDGQTEQLATTKTRLEQAKKSVAELDGSVAELREHVAAAHAAVESAEQQLGAVVDRAKGVAAAAEAAASDVEALDAALAAANEKKQEVDNAVSELESVARSLASKKAEAKGAIEHVDELMAQRSRQSATLAGQMAEVEALLAHKAAVVAPQATQTAPKAALDGRAATAAAAEVSTPAAEPMAARTAEPQDSEASEAVCPNALTVVQMLAMDDAIGAEAAAQLSGLLVAGRAADAVRASKEQASKAQSPTPYLLVAGAILEEDGDVSGAHEAYKAASKAKGELRPAARYQLALALQDLGKPEEATRVAAALDKDKEGGILALNVKGRGFRLAGFPDEAAEQFSKALESPGFADWHYHETLYNMGQLNESRGDADSMALALWSYEELSAGNPAYRDVAQRLEGLRSRLAQGAVAAHE